MNNLDLKKLIFRDLISFYEYENKKIKATEKLKRFSDMGFNLHCKYVMEQYNKFITVKNLENLTTEEKILEDYVQLLNLENMKRNFK